MGQYDSSLTRVEPVFGQLCTRDGPSWLPKLVCLPICGNVVSLPANCDFHIQSCDYGEKERKLSPPLALLSWLIRHPEKLAQSNAAHETPMPHARRELLNGSETRVTEALTLLRHNPQGERWHIFEGETQPDVYIETSNFVVVIEGKRTEWEPTTKTKWMIGRHQMIRHIDCAWEARWKKQVVGFFIVQGEGGKEEVPAKWQEFAKNTISAEALACSLPHRGPGEQREIAACFAGVTTWERVCREFGIDLKTLPETVVQRATAAKPRCN